MKGQFLTAAAMSLVVASVAQAQNVPKVASGSDAQPVAVMLEQAIYQEETAGNLDAAVKTYNQIVEQAAVSRALVAQALTRLAALEVKQKQLTEALITIDRLKREYSEQKDLIAKAEALLPGADSSTAAEPAKIPPTPEEKQQAAELVKQGWQSYQDGKFQAAADLFTSAVKKDPQSVDAWNGLGWARMNSNPMTGQNEFSIALHLDPKNAMALNGMGWANSHLGGEDEKRRTSDYWRRAVEIDPTATSPMRGLAQTALENADFDEAIKWYEKWLALDPKNADATAGVEPAKQGKTAVHEATAVATDFFKMLDDGQFADTRNLTVPRPAGCFVSGDVRAQTQRQFSSDEVMDWEGFLKKCRSPLGATVARQIESIRYSQNGRILGTAGSHGFDFREQSVTSSARSSMLLVFNTKYENKKNTVEILSFLKNADGQWKITGYAINESAAPHDPLKG